MRKNTWVAPTSDPNGQVVNWLTASWLLSPHYCEFPLSTAAERSFGQKSQSHQWGKVFLFSPLLHHNFHKNSDITMKNTFNYFDTFSRLQTRRTASWCWYQQNSEKFVPSSVYGNIEYVYTFNVWMPKRTLQELRMLSQSLFINESQCKMLILLFSIVRNGQ